MRAICPRSTLSYRVDTAKTVSPLRTASHLNQENTMQSRIRTLLTGAVCLCAASLLTGCGDGSAQSALTEAEEARRQAEDQLSDAEDNLSTLEDSLDEVRAELEEQREIEAQLREELDEARDQNARLEALLAAAQQADPADPAEEPTTE
ncbi:MAG: hypothetical protein DWQ34_21135 [Planctomycetota bacterium]|nr:MAG: hypothetical protein DWQ34_21135 [Planctomycetota bacterium]REK20438.1 MAG: hypothetical protein DWQ41_25225 [Planctomycetota bacterium]REK29269.1 MAG: hypothetical protein DWQ45_23135 [Planctomycetota bacterium]